MELKEYLESPLKEFDRYNLNHEYQRRAAVIPLYDFFQRLVFEVGVKNCHIKQSKLRQKGLSDRWHLVKYHLEGSNVWDTTIGNLSTIRNKIAHIDDHYPKHSDLHSIRQCAPSFKEWILASGEESYRQSEGLSFVENFVKNAKFYCRRAMDIPSLVDMQEPIQTRLGELKSIHDFTGDDLQQLILLVREVERYDQREFTCPKCGGRLAEYFEPVGCVTGSHIHDELNRVIGCDSCDYVKSRERT